VKQRLQRILAQAGHGSRRSAELLIEAGRVRVNGQVATLGMQADPDADEITLDGARITIAVERSYLAMHKPRGYTTTARDPHASRTVMELLPAGTPHAVRPVGRLDVDTEGLLLFTDDGELAHRLAHPRYETAKEYHVLVRGRPSPSALERFRRGVVIDDKRTAPAEVEVAGVPHGHRDVADHTWLRITIHEGRKRQVRRMCAAVGHQVRELVRTRVGPIALEGIGRGRTRVLTEKEVAALREIVRL
jgi:pseudouridine synthase